MKCVICQHGETKQGLVTVTLERDECIIVLKKVTAEICDNCGEYYLSDAITEQVLEKAELAVNNGANWRLLDMQFSVLICVSALAMSYSKYGILL